jgi:hypothetical protein
VRVAVRPATAHWGIGSARRTHSNACSGLCKAHKTEGCIYSDRQLDQRVSSEAGLARHGTRGRVRKASRTQGFRDTAPSRLTMRICPAVPPNRRWAPPPIRMSMGSCVARQCSGNRCLARWTVWIPHRGPLGRAGRANSKKDLVTSPNPRFQCPSRWADHRGGVSGLSLPCLERR